MTAFGTRLFATAMLLLMSSVPSQAEWSIDAMNEQIEKTNVEVGGVCSGTIISAEERIILTAHHCIDGQVVEVKEKTVDEKTGEVIIKTVQKKLPLSVKVHKMIDYEIVSTDDLLVKIVGIDPKNDIALLQVVDPDFKPQMAAKLAADNHQLKRGMRVYAVGNPGVTYGNSVTEGIVSAPERTVSFGPGQEFKLFQHSAPVIGGNSGGSILNENGELIGTVTGGLRGTSISFAIPIARTKDLIRRAGFERILK
jgi:S1-C subfamily serine protease